MIDPDPHVAAYKALLPRYQRLASLLEHLLQLRVDELGLRHPVAARAKDIGSFAKKVVRKGYTDPLVQMPDMAAARIVVNDLHEATAMERVVREVLLEDDREGILERHRPHEMGYLGTNFVGRVRPQLLPPGMEELRDLVCEVQVHTRAQNLWSDMAHPFLYKPAVSPPVEVQRQLYGLSVFVETFDSVLKRALTVIYSADGYQEAAMMRALDRLFYHFAENRYDDQLTLEVLGALKRSYTDTELSHFQDIMADFVKSEEPKLAHVFRRGKANDLCTPFLFQPESLVVFERIEKDPDALATNWSAVMPPKVLEELQTMWGTRFE